jgi:hypothetical protein
MSNRTLEVARSIRVSSTNEIRNQFKTFTGSAPEKRRCGAEAGVSILVRIDLEIGDAG